MKNLLEILQENPNALTLSEKDVIRYNAVLSNPAEIKEQGGPVLYSVYEIDIANNAFKAQNRNAWGKYLDESGKLSDITLNT
jgi:hypothetical protein